MTDAVQDRIIMWGKVAAAVTVLLTAIVAGAGWLKSVQELDTDLHRIESSLGDLGARMEEYQDSALAQRQRRYCRENPGGC